MTENSYTGFGSQIAFKPKHLFLSDNDKNFNNSVTQWHNLRLQLRYFTAEAHPESTVNNVNATTSRDYESSNNSAVDVDIKTDKRVLVIKSESCESFHSCRSFVSKHNLLKNNQDCGKKKRHQHSINKSSEEGFIDQITVINAIFLDKKTYENLGNNSAESTFKLKNKDLLDERNEKTPERSVNTESCSTSPDRCSGDKSSTKDYTNSKPSPLKNHKKNKVTFRCGKVKHQEHYVTGKTKLFHEKLFRDNSVLKTFRNNRRITLGTRKPFISKLINRRQAHKAILHKLQPFKIHEIKYSEAYFQSDATPYFREDNEKVHRGTLFLWKQAINEGYEMHFLEPIQVTFYSQNFKKNSNINVLSYETEGCSQNLESKINSYDDLEESFLKLFNTQQNSYTSVQLSEEIGISADFANESQQGNVNENSNSKLYLKFELTKVQDSLSEKSLDQGDITVLYKSEAKHSDLSLNETFFETIFKRDSINVTDIKYQEEETSKGYKEINKSSVMESSESEIKNKTEQDTKTKSFSKTINHNLIGSAKHRSLSNRKNTLPVIEETLEETSVADVSDNDYCLVDTLGRSIHLFDHRGLPLTDGSGRPLRSSAGELLMKCDNNGIPVVDEETQIFDMFRRQPHEEDFQPWMSPSINGASRLTTDDGRPLVLFDLQGRPLTSISGTMLVDSSGRGLLKLRNYVLPSTASD